MDGGNNFNWNFAISIVASWTLDTNNNGRIDRIRVQVKPGNQLNNAFGGLVAACGGYTVTGYLAVGAPHTDVFDITLAEGTEEDTAPRRRGRSFHNTSLDGMVGGPLVDHNTEAKLYVAASGARPVITYTTAAVGSTKVYVHFSALPMGTTPARAARDGTAGLRHG